MIFRPDVLKGRVALVTGGGTGIGFGIADLLARAGADVAIASRRPKHLAPARERLAAHGTRVLALETNVREPDTIGATVARVRDELGRLDILVNNAAGNFYAPAASLSSRAWSAVVETDLYGTFYTSQAVYPVMQRQGGGRIISISMTLHYRGWPLMAHATAAKAGVDALTRTLALEWAGDHITVNAIAPGPIPTAGATNAFERPRLGPDPDGAAQQMNDEMLRHIPLKRWGTPEDVANMVVYLASPAGDWITGAVFVVDGGSWLAR